MNYQPGYPYYPPPRRNSSATIILILLGLMGVGFVVAGIALAAFLFISNSKTAPSPSVTAVNASAPPKTVDSSLEFRKSAMEALAKANQADKGSTTIEEPETIVDTTTPKGPSELRGISSALNNLKSGIATDRQEALEFLLSQPTESNKRSEVEEGVIALLKKRDASNVADVVKCLDKYGVKTRSAELSATLSFCFRNQAACRAVLDYVSANFQRECAKDLIVLLGTEHNDEVTSILKKVPVAELTPLLQNMTFGDVKSVKDFPKTLKTFGINRDEVAYETLAEILTKASGTQAETILLGLSEMPVNTTAQPEIQKAIISKSAERTLHGKILLALLQWGSEEHYVRMAGMAESISSNNAARVKLAKLLVTKPSKETAAGLASLIDLPDPEGAQVLEALQAIGVDGRIALLSEVNDADESVRKGMRKTLLDIGVTNAELVGQCLADLDSPSKRIGAAEFLSELQLVPEKRVAISAALFRIILEPGVTESDREALGKALSVWGTKPDVLTVAKSLDDLYSGWEPRYELLVRMGVSTEIGKFTYEKMTYSFRRDPVIEIMRKAGKSAEPLAILMLDHEEEEAVEAMCELLGEIGTSKSLGPLKNVHSIATRKAYPKVAIAASLAMEQIQARPEPTDTATKPSPETNSKTGSKLTD